MLLQMHRGSQSIISFLFKLQNLFCRRFSCYVQQLAQPFRCFLVVSMIEQCIQSVLINKPGQRKTCFSPKYFLNTTYNRAPPPGGRPSQFPIFPTSVSSNRNQKEKRKLVYILLSFKFKSRRTPFNNLMCRVIYLQIVPDLIEVCCEIFQP